MSWGFSSRPSLSVITIWIITNCLSSLYRFDSPHRDSAARKIQRFWRSCRDKNLFQLLLHTVRKAVSECVCLSVCSSWCKVTMFTLQNRSYGYRLPLPLGIDCNAKQLNGEMLALPLLFCFIHCKSSPLLLFQESCPTSAVLRQINPQEAQLLTDPSRQSKVRFR